MENSLSNFERKKTECLKNQEQNILDDTKINYFTILSNQDTELIF
jgi:hypothetical protein